MKRSQKLHVVPINLANFEGRITVAVMRPSKYAPPYKAWRCLCQLITYILRVSLYIFKILAQRK